MLSVVHEPARSSEMRFAAAQPATRNPQPATRNPRRVW